MKAYQHRIRAHHGMCLAFFKGKGYSSEFSRHMGEMKRIFEENPTVCIIRQTDEICSACPNNQQGICETEEKVAEYDRQVLSYCDIAENTVMPFAEFEEAVYKKILLPGKREEICGNCQWNELCYFEKEKTDSDAN